MQKKKNRYKRQHQALTLYSFFFYEADQKQTGTIVSTVKICQD